MANRDGTSGDPRTTDSFKRWRTGDFRAWLTQFKINKAPAKTHPRERGLFDFRGVNLRMGKLEGVGLQRCCLSEAELYQAHLKGANLSYSEFISADLCHANLGQANMQGSNFTNANLKGADFTGAQLQGTHFTSAQLVGANFQQANIKGANFSMANLVGVKGLETAVGIPSNVSDCIMDAAAISAIRDTELGRFFVKAGVMGM